MSDEPLDLHDAQSAIAEAFTDHDMKALAAMTPEQRAKQHAARWAVWRHADKIWHAPHLRSKGKHPVDVGGYEGVAALLELLSDLIGNVELAQQEAGDDTDAFTVVVKVKHIDDLEPGDVELDEV